MPTAVSKLTAVAEVAGILKQVDQAFTAYQVARNTFVTALQGFLERLDPQNVMLEALMKNDVLATLCCPLAQDPVPGIQALALQNMSKLAACDPLLSQAVVSCGVLDSVVLSMGHESAPVQSGANMVLASVAGSSVDFARRVLEAGAMPGILTQLHSGTPSVKESAVRNLTSLIGSHRDHAGLIADQPLLSLLVALLSAPDSPPPLAKAVVHCLATTAHYGPDMAAEVIKADALLPVSLLVRGGGPTPPPPDLRAAALNCLAHIAAHNEELAAQVAGPGLVEAAVAHLADKMVPPVRRAASALLLQLGRKTPSLASRVCLAGCPAALAKFLQMDKEGDGCSTGVTLAGTLAGYSPTTAKAVVDAGVGAEVVQALRRHGAGGAGSPAKPAAGGGGGGASLKATKSGGGTASASATLPRTTPAGYSVGSTAPGAPVGIPEAAAWALEQMAQHGEETTMPLIAQGALAAVLDGYKATAAAAAAAATTPGGPEASASAASASAVFTRCKAALKALLRNCNSTAPLEPLVADGTPPAVLKHVLRRAQPLLAADAKSRQQFVTSGGLMRLQEVEGQLCGKGRTYLAEINQLFPADVVTYYRAGAGGGQRGASEVERGGGGISGMGAGYAVGGVEGVGRVGE